MIPALSMIVAAYVLFRFAEVFCYAPARYSSKWAHLLASLLAALAGIVVLLNLFDILTAATQVRPPR